MLFFGSEHLSSCWDGTLLGVLLPLSWVGVASGDVDSKSGKGSALSLPSTSAMVLSLCGPLAQLSVHAGVWGRRRQGASAFDLKKYMSSSPRGAVGSGSG